MAVKEKETIWVRLKRVILRLKINFPKGDGGLFTDKAIIVTKPQTDSTFVVKDSATIAYPNK